MNKVREILLTQYIGSILVALLGWQAGVEVITGVVRNGFWFVNHQRTQSVLGPSGTPFPWDNLIFSAVTAVLYLLTAYLLARWLYPATAPPAVSDADAEQSPDQPEHS